MWQSLRLSCDNSEGIFYETNSHMWSIKAARLVHKAEHHKPPSPKTAEVKRTQNHLARPDSSEEKETWTRHVI